MEAPPLNTWKKYASAATAATVLAGGLWAASTWTASAAAAPSNWTQYVFNNAGSGDNTGESTLTTADAAKLKAAWTAHGGRASSAQPLVVGSTVYWGSWDGNLHATSVSTGASLWTRAIGTTTCSGCNPKVAGAASTPAYGAIGSTPVLWAFGGGNDKTGGGQVAVFAINATTGAVIWRTNIVAVGGDTFAWSSVRVFGGSVYVSTSSLADQPVIAARVYKLDATTGAMQASASVGGGVFGTLTIDSATGDIYVPVGGPSGGGTDFAFSLLELRASNLSVVAHWTVPKAQLLADGDFGSVPTLFTATISGTARQLVGLGNKNGIFYAWDRTNIAAGPVWERTVATSGDNPQGGDGTLSPAVWDGSTLYVAGGTTKIGGKSCAGGVRALNPATGASKWEFCATTGHVLGALAAAPGLIAVPAGPSVLVLNASNGKQLFSYKNPSGAQYWGAPSIGQGHLFAPGMDGSLTALSPS
jgi:polyvinyl alcohol dehydrogenase (cytochrome)